MLVFVVHKVHCKKAIDGCHWGCGHQGQNWTASLLLDHFWWPGKATEGRKAVKSSERCIKHEGEGGKAPLHPIVATCPWI